MASPGRVQAPDINLRPQLNPAPVVQVAMVRPVNRDGAGSNLMGIAEALSGLSGTFSRLTANSGNAKAEADKNFVKVNAWRSPQDIVNQPGYDPRSEPQQVLVGQATANELGPKMQQWVMEEWDPEKQPDLYQFLSGRLGELQGQMPPAAQAGFGASIDTHVRDTIKWWDGIQNDKANLAMKQNTFAHFISLSTAFKDLPVEQRVLKMKEMGLDQYRALKFTDGKGSNDLLMNAIDHFAAAGDKDMVRALGTLRRGSNNEVPSLYDMPEFRDRVDAATAKADAEWVKLEQAKVGDFYKQEAEVIKTGDLNKLTELYNGPVGSRLFPNPADRGDKLRAAEKKLNDTILTNTVDAEKSATLSAHKGTAVQNFWTGNGGQNYGPVEVITKDGKKSTWDGNKEAQAAIDEDIRLRYEQAAGDPVKIAELDKSIARAGSQAPFKITEWENVFSGALTSATTNALLEGKVPPNLKRGFELWQNTRDNPRVRRKNMGEGADQTDNFFSLVDTFKTAGYGEAEAFVAANTALPNMGKAIGRASEELYGQNSSTYAIRDYPMDIQDKILNRTSAYMASGTMGQSRAAEKALKDFEEEVIKVDDFGSRPSFISVPNKAMNKDTLKSDITSFVQRQVELHGGKQDMPIDLKNVNIFDYGNGRYGLQNNDGEPIPAFLNHRGGQAGRGVQFFTLDDVQQQVKADADAQAALTNAKNKDTANTNDQFRKNPNSIIDPEGKGRSAAGVLIDNVFGGDAKPKEDTSILKGNTGNAEDVFGATTGDQLRKLSDARLGEVYSLSKEGKLNVSGFVTDRTVKQEVQYRVRASGYSKAQINSAMTRWNTTNELEAIRRLKENNVKPEK